MSKSTLPQPLRYIPVAEYEFGACSCFRGPCKASRVVVVHADSMVTARRLANGELKLSTIEHMVHIETRPNPEHLAYIQTLSAS